MKPLTPASPHAILMIGIPGAGKSSFAERFAETFQAPILNFTKLQNDFGLSLRKTDELRNEVLSQLLKTKRTLLLDGGTQTKAQRAELVKKLAAAGYTPLVVWVQTDTNESKRRASKPYPQGSGLNSDEFDTAVKAFQPPLQQEKPIVISGKHTYATQLKVVLKHIVDHSPRQATPEPPRPDQPRPAGRGILIR
jgi:shikimate kinase